MPCSCGSTGNHLWQPDRPMRGSTTELHEALDFLDKEVPEWQKLDKDELKQRLFGLMNETLDAYNVITKATGASA